jgi:hypothetical protein
LIYSDVMFGAKQGRRISHSTARAAVQTSAIGFEPRANPAFPARVAGLL